MHKSIAYIIFAISAILCGGCSYKDADPAYSQYKSIGNEGWPRNREIEYSLSSKTDSLRVSPGIYDLAISIRHNINYKYSDLWLVLTSVSLNQEERTDTIRLRLADSEGNWLGKGYRALRIKNYVVARNVNIDPSWQLSLKHIMDCDTLHNIDDLGVILLNMK